MIVAVILAVSLGCVGFATEGIEATGNSVVISPRPCETAR